MPLLPDLGLAAAAAGVVFFVLLGIFVVFLETMERKLLLGGAFTLIGLTFALVLMDEAGIAMIALAVMSALVVDQAIEHFTEL